MRVLRRFLVVLLAYLCAALAVSGAFLAFAFFSSDGGGWDVKEILFGLSFFFLIAVTYASPVALPVILFTELRKVGHWAVFAIAGFVLAVLLTIAFTEVPYRGLNVELVVTMFIGSMIGALIYWLVAWRMLSPPFSAAPAGE